MCCTLKVVQGRPEGKRLLFPPGQYLFGRARDCHVRPNSDWVSRRHCLLRVGEDGVFVVDLGSRHGTLVNGCCIFGDRQLLPGDRLQVGPIVFEVQPAGPVRRLIFGRCPRCDHGGAVFGFCRRCRAWAQFAMWGPGAAAGRPRQGQEGVPTQLSGGSQTCTPAP